MSLPLENLDNRLWSDLVDEGRALIPRYAPTWTDHNASQPGITLMELFAWLTEMTVYRLNRVPDRHLRKFLGLLGLYSFPPRAAEISLSFLPEEGSAFLELPAGAEFRLMNSGKSPVIFRTLNDVSLSFVALSALQREELNLADDSGERVFVDLTQDWQDGLSIEPLGRNPNTDPAFYLGFDTLPAEIPIAFGLHFQGSGTGGTERTRLKRETLEQAAACRPIRPDIACEDAADLLPLQPGLLSHHSLRLVWEVLTGIEPNQWTMLEPATGPTRPDVGEVMDDTRCMSLSGIVEVNLPDSMQRGAVGQVMAPLFYLRCRPEAGSYDAPPILSRLTVNSVIAEQAIPVWQQFEIAPGITINGTRPDGLQAVKLNFILDGAGLIQSLTFLDPADGDDHPGLVVLDYAEPGLVDPGHITLEATRAGVGNGRPEQHFQLSQAPVQIESLEVYTHLDESWQRWSRREDLDASSRVDFHFTLDATTGEIAFGTGERGCVVPNNAVVLATYRTTQGELGNLRPQNTAELADTPLNASLLSDDEHNRMAAMGITVGPFQDGAAEESLDETIGRAVEMLYAHQRLIDLCTERRCRSLDDVARDRVLSLAAPSRGVNLLDIERLALDVPGTQIARARAWAASHPSYPCLQAEGVVTVTIVPDLPVAKPEPSAGLLQTVKNYLERRRMVTTRLELTGPKYLAVSVNATVRAKPFANVDEVRNRIAEALKTFLDPRIGGPDGLGWPFGRDVYRSEILQLIDNVVNVDYVLELSLAADAGEPQCGNLNLCPTWLVTSGEHRLEVVRGAP